MIPKPNMQDIVIMREFNYPVELVWKAWTDPSLVMQWWGPSQYTSPRCKIDFRGIRYRVYSQRESNGVEDYGIRVVGE